MDFRLGKQSTVEFFGPLDLLLSLIQEKKMDISEIALSEVTQQYLGYVEQLGAERAEEIADFLVIASRLLLLKARALIPDAEPEEEDGMSLADQLRLYQHFVTVSRHIHKIWMGEKRGFSRIEPPRRPTAFTAPQHLSGSRLQESMRDLLKRLKVKEPLIQATIDAHISLKQTIQHIQQMLQKKKSFHFFETLKERENKTALIVGFLALLELVKRQSIQLSQSDAFSDILIERTRAKA